MVGDHCEADYGGRVDLRVLYGSDLRNNALFRVVRERSAGGEAGQSIPLGNGTVLIDRPPTEFYEVNTGTGDDTIDFFDPNSNRFGRWYYCEPAWGDGSIFAVFATTHLFRRNEVVSRALNSGHQ